MAGLVRIKVSAELLRQALKLPEAVSVWKAEVCDGDLRDGLVTLLLMSDAFAETVTPEEIPDVMPVVTRHAERLSWKFGEFVEID